MCFNLRFVVWLENSLVANVRALRDGFLITFAFEFENAGKPNIQSRNSITVYVHYIFLVR